MATASAAAPTATPTTANTTSAAGMLAAGVVHDRVTPEDCDDGNVIAAAQAVWERRQRRWVPVAVMRRSNGGGHCRVVGHE